MANQTAAFGIVLISAERKENLKDFIYLQLLSEKGTIYPTTLLDVATYGKINKEKVFNTLDTLITKDKGKHQVELRVDGIGQKAFKDNIKSFFEKPLNKEYEDETINSIRDRLKTVNLEATFDIRDYYTYSKYIDNSVYNVEHLNGNNTLTTLEDHLYDYNAENLMKFYYCDVAIDKKYALDYLEQFKKDVKDSELPQELLEDDNKLQEVLSKLDDTIYDNYEDFIDQILENL